MDGEFRTKAEEKAHLTKIIKEWNDSRLDMFALTMPDNDLQFHGVMRFYFQDAGMKVVTKCIRVSSKTSVGELMDTLVEKFCPDMKMLTPTNYELFECHEKGDTRKLGKSERPLLVQLSWHRDDREGRFLLKSASAKVSTKFFDINREEGQFKRRLSRREKKELKKRRKQELLKEKDKGSDDTAIAQQLYNELPETSLTRSISNPEAVMKRRRQQKLEKRLKEFQKNDGQQTGGTLKIFAETLKPEIPYKTILASINQTSDKIVQDAIEKFQLDEKNPDDYCIVMTMIPPGDNPGPGKERVVRDNDCPLAIQSSWPSSRGFLTFHLRKRYTVPGYNKKDKPAAKKVSDAKPDMRVAERLAHKTQNKSFEEELPFLVEVIPNDGEVDYQPRMLRIKPNVTVVGSNKSPLSEQYFALHAPDVMHKHCVIANMEGAVTITPSNSDSLVIVDGQRIHETTVLRHGSVVTFGRMLAFEFNNRDGDGQLNQSVSSNRSFNEPKVRSPRMDQSFDDQSNELNRSSSLADKPYQSLSPVLMEQILREQSGSQVDDELIVETTFGVDGEIESSPVRKTAPVGLAKSSTDIHETEKENQKRLIDMSYGQSAPDLAAMGNHKQPSHEQMDQDLALLPASLEFIDDAQDVFLAAVISEVNGSAVHFKLAPAYSLYLACHYMISPDYRPELGGVEHARVVGITTRKMAIAIEKTIEENDGLAGSLAFWMANASELLHFLKQDTELSPLTQNSQGILAQTVQHAFRLLVLAMEDELALAMPAFLDPSENVDIPEHDLEHILQDDMLERAESSDLLNWTSDERTFPVQDGRPISGHHWVTPATRIRHHGQPVLTDVLYILSSAMSLLRRCRVNAALTIQLFSQLFHFINMWLFNKLVLEPQLGLCTRAWGQRLRRRLSFVEAWAEKQGLELAAECHLCRVVQAAHLLEAPKISAEDIASISSTCFKLNSLQLRALLRMYRPDRSEHVISPELIESVASVAEHTADELARSDGREVRLDEDEELQLPFLLPEDGYSCDIIRGVPSGLQEFLEALIQSGICNFAIEPMSSGLWTIHQEQYYDDYEQRDMNDQQQQQFDDEKHEILEVTLQKGNRGLGLSIVAAKGPKSDDLGIYIKGVVEGGSAHQNGMLQPGDQLLSVNGMSLVDVSQETAAKLMGKADTIVTLEVYKQAAVYHGLAAFLSQPSPVSSPAPLPKSNGRMSFEDQLDRSPTINEQSPQIRTQRWIAMNNTEEDGDDGDKGYHDARELERKRREEEEYYQKYYKEQEDFRIEEDRRRMEAERIEQEEHARMEEIRREEARQAELRKIEEENLRKEAQRKMEEAQIAEAKRIEKEMKEKAQKEKEELERIEEEKARQAEQQRLAEERRIEEERQREEELETEKLMKEEEERMLRKQDEENTRFEKRQREYEERLRIMEQQQREFEERKRAKEEEEKRKRMEEDRRQEADRIKLVEEKRRLEEQAKRREEERRRDEEAKKKREEERKREEEAKKRREEERKREEEAKKRREEERKREEETKKTREEERRREEEERKRREEERKRIDAERLRRQEEERAKKIREEERLKEQAEMEMRLQMQAPTAPEDDFDDLPPPPEDMLFGDFDEDNSKDQHDQLEIRIQNQLAAEKEEHLSMQREQQKWRELDDYEETDIDNVDDNELEQRLMQERDYHSAEERSFSMDPNDVEREFQRRLQEENEKRQRVRRPLDDHEDIEKLRIERENRLEQERKIQLMIEDHDRRKNNRQFGKNTDLDNHAAVTEQQNRLQQMRINTAPKSPPPDDFMALQRQKRLQQKQEQERLRNEQRELDEMERQRKLREVREHKEQEQKMMQEYRRQKELDEQRYTRNNIAKNELSQPQSLAEHKNVVKNEFKEKAVADYERRRATLDKEVEKMEREKRIRNMEITQKAPPIAKKPTSITISTNDDDEPAPPRPPPPSNPTPTAIVRSSVSPSPSPHLPTSTRFSYSSKTVANVNASSQARASPTSPPNRYSPSGQNRNMLSSRVPSRDDPSVLDFKQKMKMFGSQSTATNNDNKSTYSRKQRAFMD